MLLKRIFIIALVVLGFIFIGCKNQATQKDMLGKYEIVKAVDPNTKIELSASKYMKALLGAEPTKVYAEFKETSFVVTYSYEDARNQKVDCEVSYTCQYGNGSVFLSNKACESNCVSVFPYGSEGMINVNKTKEGLKLIAAGGDYLMLTKIAVASTNNPNGEVK